MTFLDSGIVIDEAWKLDLFRNILDEMARFRGKIIYIL